MRVPPERSLFQQANAGCSRNCFKLAGGIERFQACRHLLVRPAVWGRITLVFQSGVGSLPADTLTKAKDFYLNLSEAYRCTSAIIMIVNVLRYFVIQWHASGRESVVMRQAAFLPRLCASQPSHCASAE